MSYNDKAIKILENACKQAHNYGYNKITEEVLLNVLLNDEWLMESCIRHGIDFGDMPSKVFHLIRHQCCADDYENHYLNRYPDPFSLQYSEAVNGLLHSVQARLRQSRTKVTPFDLLIGFLENENSLFNKLKKPVMKYDVTFEVRPR